MSGLKDRLRRLTKPTEQQKEACVVPNAADLQTEISETESATASLAEGSKTSFSLEPPILEKGWSSLEAELVTCDRGSFVRRRRLYPHGHRHGHWTLDRLADDCIGELAAFHEGQAPVKHEELLFFDTETTGLGLGAGNVPFMVGIGYWEESGFAVEQLFIRNPAEELAMLAYLTPILQKHPYLVSYNGRAFDWPLLKNRYVLNRMKDEAPEPLQLDFLYPSRSLWKNTLPSCRLGKVEEGKLGFHRVDDTPGSLAPTLYFQYLAEKDPALIRPVFLHNELDILSLSGLAIHFSHALAGRLVVERMGAEERFRLALWLHKLGKPDLCDGILEGLGPDVCKEAVVSGSSGYWGAMAAHYKQTGVWEKAVSLWEALIRVNRETPASRRLFGEAALEPYIELSMHYEHRMKEPETALLYAEEALEWTAERRSAMKRIKGRGKPSSGNKEGHAPNKQGGLSELERRIDRLRRKVERRQSTPASAEPLPRPITGGAEIPREAAAPSTRSERSRKRRSAPSAVHETLTLF